MTLGNCSSEQQTDVQHETLQARYSQFYGGGLVWRMVEAYETKRNIRFTSVLRLRPDLVFAFKSILFHVNESLSNNGIVPELFEGKVCAAKSFVMIPRYFAEVYFSYYKSIQYFCSSFELIKVSPIKAGAGVNNMLNNRNFDDVFEEVHSNRFGVPLNYVTPWCSRSWDFYAARPCNCTDLCWGAFSQRGKDVTNSLDHALDSQGVEAGINLPSWVTEVCVQGLPSEEFTKGQTISAA